MKKVMLLIVLAASIIACKKDDSSSSTTPVTPPPVNPAGSSVYFMALGTDTVTNPSVSTGKTGNNAFVKAQFTTGDPVCFIYIYDDSIPRTGKTYTLIDQHAPAPLKAGDAYIKYIANGKTFLATGGVLNFVLSGTVRKLQFTGINFSDQQAQNSIKGSASFEVK